MAKARSLDKRRKSVRNIRKITRTMELIATAQFRRAMDRALSAASYTERIVELVSTITRADSSDLAGASDSHPLLQTHDRSSSASLLIMTANRGMCGGYNSSILRLGMPRWKELRDEYKSSRLEVSGKRGIATFLFNKLRPDQTYTHFENKPTFEEVDELAQRFLEAYKAGTLDRLEVVYTKFHSLSRQEAVVETLLPMADLAKPKKQVEESSDGNESEANAESYDAAKDKKIDANEFIASPIEYEFLPSPHEVLDELVPLAFRMKFFKCFLDAAVSEQVARMVAMKAATENADSMIGQLTMTYNRARQGQITNEILEVISGAEALS
jgi:F-type H+-transporting ATPase subunit gamma